MAKPNIRVRDARSNRARSIMKKVIIAGSRSYPANKEQELLIRQWLNAAFRNFGPVIVICGAARGIDTLGAIVAQEQGCEVEYYPADWSIGKRAGYLRNVEMAQNADELWLIWDGKSKGSAHMKNIASAKGLLVLEYVL